MTKTTEAVHECVHEWERECYGCTQDDLIASIKCHARFTTSSEMLVGSILSDVQEMLSRIDDDPLNRECYKKKARQALNRAKFILFNPEIAKPILETSR